MLTKTKKKANRWQALALAALVLAGGSIAVPQAANASTIHTKDCSWDASVCKTRVTVKKTGASTRHLYIRFSTPSSGYRVVDLSRGKVLCKGQFPAKAAHCAVSNRSAVLSIEVKQQPFFPLGGGQISYMLF